MPDSKNDPGGRLLKQIVHDLLARKDFAQQSQEVKKYDPARLCQIWRKKSWKKPVQ